MSKCVLLRHSRADGIMYEFKQAISVDNNSISPLSAAAAETTKTIATESIGCDITGRNVHR